MAMDLHINYDSICYHMFNGIKNLSAGASRICYSGFDHKNEEHLFILALTVACSGVLGDRDIAIDGSAWARMRLHAKYRKAVNIYKLSKKDDIVINIEELIEGLRGYACSVCGEDFRFGDIYHAFYCEGENK